MKKLPGPVKSDFVLKSFQWYVSQEYETHICHQPPNSTYSRSLHLDTKMYFCSSSKPPVIWAYLCHSNDTITQAPSLSLSPSLTHTHKLTQSHTTGTLSHTHTHVHTNTISHMLMPLTLSHTCSLTHSQQFRNGLKNWPLVYLFIMSVVNIPVLLVKFLFLFPNSLSNLQPRTPLANDLWLVGSKVTSTYCLDFRASALPVALR